MAKFMVLIRDEGVDFSRLTPAELQQMFGVYRAWSQALRERGVMVGAEKLADEGGRSIRTRGGELVVEGPYADAKELVTGFYLLTAADYDAAVALAKGCPALSYGGSVEVRRVDTP